jgi:hypothetical protein
MAAHHVDSLAHGQPRGGQVHITGTGTPAEDSEGERTENRLWSLKEDAKWGKDAETQKKAIRDLEMIGTPALSQLEEIWSIVPSGEIKQYCLDAINRIISHQPSEARRNGVEEVVAAVEKASRETKV